MRSYTIRIPVDAAEILVLFGHESVRRSILAIPTIFVTTTIIRAPVRPDNGDRDYPGLSGSFALLICVPNQERTSANIQGWWHSTPLQSGSKYSYP
jgi:hypothetical protein